MGPALVPLPNTDHLLSIFDIHLIQILCATFYSFSTFCSGVSEIIHCTDYKRDMKWREKNQKHLKSSSGFQFRGGVGWSGYDGRLMCREIILAAQQRHTGTIYPGRKQPSSLSASVDVIKIQESLVLNPKIYCDRL